MCGNFFELQETGKSEDKIKRMRNMKRLKAWGISRWCFLRLGPSGTATLPLVRVILETADRADESVIPIVIAVMLWMRRLRISHYVEAGHLWWSKFDTCWLLLYLVQIGCSQLNMVQWSDQSYKYSSGNVKVYSAKKLFKVYQNPQTKFLSHGGRVRGL